MPESEISLSTGSLGRKRERANWSILSVKSPIKIASRNIQVGNGKGSDCGNVASLEV